MMDQELDFCRIKNGVRARRTQTRASRERDIKIHNMQEDLVNKRLSLKQFLLMFTANHNNFQMDHLISEEDELSSDVEVADMEFFSDNLNEIFDTNRQTRHINTRRRRCRYVHDTPSSAREGGNETNAEDELSNDVQIVSTGEVQENLNETFETNRQTESRRVHDISLSDLREKENEGNAEDEVSSDVEIVGVEVLENLNETFQTNRQTESRHENDIPLPNLREEGNEGIADDTIYEIPEDDYGYLSENNSNTHNDEPFHTIN